MKKEVTLLELKKNIGNKKNKKIVVTGVFFEFLEPWHIDLFDFAKGNGDILVVILFSKETLIPPKERIEILDAIDVVDMIYFAGKKSLENIFIEIEGIDLLVLNREIIGEETELHTKFAIKRFKQ